MRYTLFLLSLCYGSLLYASDRVPLAEIKDSDSNAPQAQSIDIPEKQKTPLLQPYVTDKGERAELVTPELDAPEYAIIPIPVEHPDPLDDSSERSTDSQWELLSW